LGERGAEAPSETQSGSIRDRHHRLRAAFGQVQRVMRVRALVRVAATASRRTGTDESEAAAASSGVPESDESLLSRYHAGDVLAFEQLYRRYARKAQALALNLTRDSDDAREIVQEAFMRVIRRSRQFEGQCAFYTWLYRIVFNLSIDRNRRALPQYTTLAEQTVFSVDASVLSTASMREPDPFEHCVIREAYESVAQALSCLSATHRRTLVMRELYGMSYSEIANLEGCSKGTVMSRLFHARQRIHQELANLSHHHEACAAGDR
jgi:RNA polymerase sigma-70 factor (ECF subfamily)